MALSPHLSHTSDQVSWAALLEPSERDCLYLLTAQTLFGL